MRNQLFCPVCKVVIERDETVRGYEVTKGQCIRVEDAELEALEAEANSSIDMREFIPIEKVDPIYFEGNYYLARGAEAQGSSRRHLCGVKEKPGDCRAAAAESRRRSSKAQAEGVGRTRPGLFNFNLAW